MKQTILSVLLSLFFVVTSFAQNNIFNHRRGLLNKKTSSFHFLETNPPIGEPRFVAEFEPMQGVMIRYPLGIPESLVADFANNCHVYCIVMDSCQNDAYQTFVDVGVDMNRVTFVNAPTDDFFIRDYGPWYIFEDKEPAIVDNLYYPEWRPKDDSIPFVFSDFWNIPIYETSLYYEGGNMMEDGRGHGVSDNRVLLANNNDEENLRTIMRNYLGIDPIHLVSPNNHYPHVDCWGKFLAPDIILIAKTPENDPVYSDFEEVANHFATTNCCWGYPYRVYRVDIPEDGWNSVAPYTNSLILNKTVYLPIRDDSIFDQNAIAVYQGAMPGYDIVPVSGCDSHPWQPGDALHCRTRGVMDFNMLFVDHRNVLHGEQEWQDSIPVVSKFIAYSGADLKKDSLLVYYSIDGGAYQVAHMTATGNPDEYVGYIKGYQGESSINYYVFGADESEHRYTQPVFAELDPHHFTIGLHEAITELSSEAKLYPNPTTGQFTVEGANVAKVEVYNLVGQKVHEAVASSLAMTGQVVNIDAAEWHKGIYLVNIIEENGAVVTKKLVVR
jgi:agmatine/peptidylarginine deiminase